jgi:hypothetical protein
MSSDVLLAEVERLLAAHSPAAFDASIDGFPDCIEFVRRLEHVETVNTGLEEAALTTARALQDISMHRDKVYDAIRRKETAGEVAP